MYYYEILEPWTIRRDSPNVKPAGYFYCKTQLGSSVAPERASRIWFEGDTFVKYTKDNLSWDREVDMKEFAWIKLKARALSDVL